MKRSRKQYKVWVALGKTRGGYILISTKEPKCSGEYSDNDYYYVTHGGETSICQWWFKRVFGWLPKPGTKQRCVVSLKKLKR